MIPTICSVFFVQRFSCRQIIPFVFYSFGGLWLQTSTKAMYTSPIDLREGGWVAGWSVGGWVEGQRPRWNISQQVDTWIHIHTNAVSAASTSLGDKKMQKLTKSSFTSGISF